METKPDDSPPLAFTQGVGTVFQFTGIFSFVIFFSVCCLSAFLSKNTATHTSLSTVSWGSYSAQFAVSIIMALGVGGGIALTTLGLGLQAQHRRTPMAATLFTGLMLVAWIVHLIFFIRSGSIIVSGIILLMSLLYAGLLLLAIKAWQDIRRTPPAEGFEILPADYKIPYSHLHQDPPEIRLAKELEQRRRKLEIQRKELEELEQKLHRKLEDDRP